MLLRIMKKHKSKRIGKALKSVIMTDGVNNDFVA